MRPNPIQTKQNKISKTVDFCVICGSEIEYNNEAGNWINDDPIMALCRNIHNLTGETDFLNHIPSRLYPEIEAIIRKKPSE